MAGAIFDAFGDEQFWRGLLARLPVNLRDVYYLPEYVRLYAIMSTLPG